MVKNYQIPSLLSRVMILLFLFSATSVKAQNIAVIYDNFDNLSCWEIEGENGSIVDGHCYIPAGSESKLFQRIQVQEGYYMLTAKVSIPNCYGKCYLYAKGEGYSMVSTEIPKTKDSHNSLTVYVRGIQTNNGEIEIGVYNEGKHDLYIDDVTLTQTDGPYIFLQGGDITELNYVINEGGNYYNSDGSLLYSNDASKIEKAQSVINFLAEKGMNFVRIRNSNSPGKMHPDKSNSYYLPDGFQDSKDCLKLAIMAHNAKMKIQYTFNYSDYWSNGERQDIPADWMDSIKGIHDNQKIVEKLADCIYNYTLGVMKELATNQIYPEYVSLGNETNGGFLFPYGYSYDVTWDNTDMPRGTQNWNAIASFINAGYKAVKEVSPHSKIVIHLADNTNDFIKYGSNANSYTYAWYFDNLLKHNAQFDVIGASYYPAWSEASVGNLVEYCKNISHRYEKEILIMESGYNFHPTRKDGWEGQLTENAAEYKDFYDFSPEGQKSFVAELLNALKSIGATSKYECVGSLYWDPVMIHVEDENGNNKTGWAHKISTNQPDANVVENTTLFDFDGVALPVWEVYEGNKYPNIETENLTIQICHPSDKSYRLYSYFNRLTIKSLQENNFTIINNLGQQICKFTLKENESREIQLSSGIYYINNTKVLIK